MKSIILVIILISVQFVSSQTIVLPFADTTKTYEVTIKHTGDSLKYNEQAYFNSDTSKIAWEFTFRKPDTVGVYREYYFNGNTFKKVIYGQNGKKHGIYQEWNENKKLTVSGQYKNGKKHGTWIYFKEKRNEVYKKGLKHGRWRIYEGTNPWNLYVYKKDSLVKVKKDIIPLVSKREKPQKKQ